MVESANFDPDLERGPTYRTAVARPAPSVGVAARPWATEPVSMPRAPPHTLPIVLPTPAAQP